MEENVTGQHEEEDLGAMGEDGSLFCQLHEIHEPVYCNGRFPVSTEWRM